MAKNLQQWLSWQESLHPSEIDLGLDRVNQVIQILLADFFDNQTQQFNFPFKIITIAGTNGKGSTVAMLEAIYSQAGYHVGTYTSPHLLHYNERIKINQQAVSDQSICRAFEKIDCARGELSLTYFEFSTLAALDIFCSHDSIADKQQKPCDVVILEVGLGGRLDAVNVVDADVALVTTVDIDHQDWLGSDKNTIAKEKAGIFRSNKPAIYGDIDLPQSIEEKVAQENIEFYQFSQDYNFASDSNHWHWLVSEQHQKFESKQELSLPQLFGNIQLKNASNTLMVLELLKNHLPVSKADINKALLTTHLMGRFQIIKQPSADTQTIILDVAHNEQAAKNLRQSIEQFVDNELLMKNAFHVIVGMLKDKEVNKVLSVFKDIVSSWRIIELDTPRAMSADGIRQILIQNSNQFQVSEINIKTFRHFKEAYEDFNEYNKDCSMQILLVFGSFHTVSDALTFFNTDS